MDDNVRHITLPVDNHESADKEGHCKGNNAVSQDINVLALVKGEERYVFLYNEKNQPEMLRVLGRYASNPELSFTWYDAAVLSQKIRQETQRQARESQKGVMTNRYNLPLSTENDQ